MGGLNEHLDVSPEEIRTKTVPVIKWRPKYSKFDSKQFSNIAKFEQGTNDTREEADKNFNKEGSEGEREDHLKDKTEGSAESEQNEKVEIEKEKKIGEIEQEDNKENVTRKEEDEGEGEKLKREDHPKDKSEENAESEQNE